MVFKELIEGYHLEKRIFNTILDAEAEGFVYNPETMEIINPETNEVHPESRDYTRAMIYLCGSFSRIFGSGIYDLLHPHKATKWREFTAPGYGTHEISSDI